MRLKDLSSYTIAKNCTDLTDLEHGINEVNSYINYRLEIGAKKIPATAYIRLYRLREKHRKFSAKYRL